MEPVLEYGQQLPICSLQEQLSSLLHCRLKVSNHPSPALSHLQRWRSECIIGARDCSFENCVNSVFIPGKFGSLEFGAGFFGFEVGEIDLHFFFIFLCIFSQFSPSISEFTSFQSIFQSRNYNFLLDIFISAGNYRIALSTADL